MRCQIRVKRCAGAYAVCVSTRSKKVHADRFSIDRNTERRTFCNSENEMRFWMWQKKNDTQQLKWTIAHIMAFLLTVEEWNLPHWVPLWPVDIIHQYTRNSIFTSSKQKLFACTPSGYYKVMQVQKGNLVSQQGTISFLSMKLELLLTGMVKLWSVR